MSASKRGRSANKNVLVTVETPRSFRAKLSQVALFLTRPAESLAWHVDRSVDLASDIGTGLLLGAVYDADPSTGR